MNSSIIERRCFLLRLKKFYDDSFARPGCLGGFDTGHPVFRSAVSLGGDFLRSVLRAELAFVCVSAFSKVAGLVMFAFGAV